MYKKRSQMKNPTSNQIRNIFLTLMITGFVLPQLVQAVTYTVGVKQGDWIKYGQLRFNWTGNGTAPAYILEQQKADWLRIEVEDVFETEVDLKMSIHYVNGTTMNQTMSFDIDTGSMGFFLVSANLTSGDKVSGQSSAPTINSTATRIYALANRDVNIIDISTKDYLNRTTTFTMCYDKATGFLLELHSNAPDFMTSGATLDTTIAATETNMWTADVIGTLASYIIYIIIAIIAIVVTIVAAVALRRKKPLPPPPPPPTQPAPQQPQPITT